VRYLPPELRQTFEMVDATLRTRIERDDLIDACACAIAARDSTSRLGGDEIDRRGLRMVINC